VGEGKNQPTTKKERGFLGERVVSIFLVTPGRGRERSMEKVQEGRWG